MLRQYRFAFVLLMALARPVSANELCAAGETSPTASDIQRQGAAVRYLAAVHTAQKRAQAEAGRYLPLHELRDLPDVPLGFVPRLVANQWSYAVWMKDLFDACGFTLFADDYGVVYDAVPRRHSLRTAAAPSES